MIDRARYNAAFNEYWTWLEDQMKAGETIIFTPVTGNPRRVLRVSDREIRLAETTKRAGSSVCKRQELRIDFWKLANDPTWRSDLPAARERHGIENLFEFKRDMYERFEPFLGS